MSGNSIVLVLLCHLQAKFEAPLGGVTAVEDLRESFGFEGELVEPGSPITQEQVSSPFRRQASKRQLVPSLSEVWICGFDQGRIEDEGLQLIVVDGEISKIDCVSCLAYVLMNSINRNT